MKQLFLFFILILLFACNNSEEKPAAAQNSQSAIEQKPVDGTITDKVLAHMAMNLQVFTRLPDTLTGCTGLYIYDSLPLSSRQYLFITNLDGLGIMQVHGKLVYLDRQSRRDLPDGGYEEVFSKEGYTVTLRTKETGKTGDELTIYSGTLEMEKSGVKKMIKVHGEVGC
jgi:hypothetical protein